MKPGPRSTLAALVLLALAAASHAQVSVKEAWVRASVPQQSATGAFMQITATQDSKLVSASSPVAPITEVHEMAMQDNVMKMREVPSVALPAGKTVELKPGGYHIMLMNLPKPLKAGDTVPLTLTVEGKDGKRESVQVSATVRPLNAPAAGDMKDMGGSGHMQHMK